MRRRREYAGNGESGHSSYIQVKVNGATYIFRQRQDWSHVKARTRGSYIKARTRGVTCEVSDEEDDDGSEPCVPLPSLPPSVVPASNEDGNLVNNSDPPNDDDNDDEDDDEMISPVKLTGRGRF